MDVTRVRAMGALVLCVACGETSAPSTPVDTAGGAAGIVDQVGEIDECAEPPAPVDGVVLDGSVGIARPSDLDALANVSEITGTLSIVSLHSGPLRLPNLRKLGSLELNGSPAPPDTTKLPRSSYQISRTSTTSSTSTWAGTWPKSICARCRRWAIVSSSTATST